ncbi:MULTISPECIES: NAD(P)-dependent alcohol dehydrogenase [unclassified Rhodococcus (in: high G+C Gram-positive bacteria)]|uniref:zinc-dependent alcohol dehydrogenase family protein n=1 Tax=unclassified Rhodococcus (in: high G+C Gram-positive bacteria) TaxID=192944 RepID=UPI001F3BE8A7|nr:MULTISPECIES: NAD(P)-dependent alcohol dehydrogenase [unclassified Rhodococcus (in: high G+C Gram-positive bacteria)]
MHEEDTPTPGREDVLIRVFAASLNFRDQTVLDGTYPGPLKVDGVPLSDGAGEVVAVGSTVTRAKVGDRVSVNCAVHWVGGPRLPEHRASAMGMTVDGMLADHVLVHENAIVHLPDYLSFVEAASLPCAAVSAWSAMNVVTPLQPGHTVLVQGTGGVALFGLQLARIFGSRVLAITSSDEKADILRGLGAESVVNYSTTPEWDREILELTDGKGVDKVIDIAGEATIVKSAASTRVGGEIGLVGFASGFGGGLPPIDILRRGITIAGIGVGPRLNFEAVLAAMATEETRPVIDRIYPFDDYREAYRRLESGKHVGKVVIDVAG